MAATGNMKKGCHRKRTARARVRCSLAKATASKCVSRDGRCNRATDQAERPANNSTHRLYNLSGEINTSHALSEKKLTKVEKLVTFLTPKVGPFCDPKSGVAVVPICPGKGPDPSDQHGSFFRGPRFGSISRPRFWGHFLGPLLGSRNPTFFQHAHNNCSSPVL